MANVLGVSAGDLVMSYCCWNERNHENNGKSVWTLSRASKDRGCWLAMWPRTSCLTSLCLRYPFLKMKKIKPSWLSISWGYWQSKWVHVQCMKCSKERCSWNVKFAFASLKMSSPSCPVPHGRASALSDKVIPQDSLSSLAPAGLLPVSA